jgi:hypothetical protein
LPTYRNDTATRITFTDKAYMHWEPGEERALAFFVPHKMLGLTKISPEPYVLRENERGFGYARLCVLNGESVVYEFPYSETIEFTVIAEAGDCRMFVGDSETPITLKAGDTHISRLPWDMSAYLTFESSKNSTVRIKCEPFATKGE